MNNISSVCKNQCLSCRSCEQICPKNAVIMKENKEGFLQPNIDENICVDCGLCKNHCPIFVSVKKNNYKQEAFASFLKDFEKSKKSTSGGIFTALAEYFIYNNGIVFGAAYDENLRVHHIGVENITDLEKIKGSKYVSSDTEYTFNEVRKLLINNKKVLYSGTPCQIAGLNAFLRKEYENLLTVDLFCHGTPSYKFFRKYLDWKELKLRSKIKYYGFRDKDVCGWTCCGNARITTEKKDFIFKGYSDPYYASFFRGESFGTKCYSCNFSTNERCGDISLGDFWGVGKIFRNLNSIQGVSAVLINSEKGKKIFQQINEKLNVYEVSPESIAKENGAISGGAKLSACNNAIYEDIDNPDLNRYFSNFKETHFLNKIKFGIRRIISFLLPSFIKKLLVNLYVKFRSAK